MKSLKKFNFALSSVISVLFLLSFSVAVRAQEKKPSVIKNRNVIGIGSPVRRTHDNEVSSPTFYLGHDFGIITILGNISYYSYDSKQKSKSKSEGESEFEVEKIEEKVSLVTPSIGIKLRLPREGIVPYIYGEVGKEFVLSATVEVVPPDYLLIDEAEEESILRDQHDDPHFIIGCGFEFPLSEHIGISGEVGISYLKYEYETEWESGYSQTFHEEDRSYIEWTSYSKIVLNYYF